MSDLLRLLRLFKPYPGWLLLGIFLSFITLLANVGLMAVSGWFITAMAMAGVTGVAVNYFTPSALIRLAAIVRTTGRYGERLVTHDATLRILAKLRVWFYQRIEPLAAEMLEQYHSGDVLSRIRADIDTLNNVYLRLLVPLGVALLATVVLVGTLLWFHPLIALVELILLLLAGVVLPWWINLKAASGGRKIVALKAQIRTALVRDLQGMAELQIYDAAERHGQRLQELSQKLAQYQHTLARLQGIAQGAVGLCANLAMWSVLLLTIPQVSSGELAPPKLAMLVLLAMASFEAIAPLPLAFQSLGEMLAAARRIFSLADQVPLVTEPDKPVPVPQRLNFSLHELGFRYAGNERFVWQGISLSFPQGHKLALIGPTGAGKSTLISLLLRFREPSMGKLLLNGIPLGAYSPEALRTGMAVVPQQTHLFNASIRDNLLMAKPDATQEELDSVCRSALLDDFISQQPQGYDTWVGETGIRLSGGQGKRLAIARALLKPAGLLILDEPSEGLDATTAEQVMMNIHARVAERGQSLLLVTHQRHGLDAMDTILRLS